MIDGLADRLKQQRWQMGLSQRDLAQRLGVSPSIISGYETGERTPSVEILLKLSGIYQCSVDYLLGRKRPPVSVQLDASGLTDNQIRLLAELIDTMRRQ